MRSQLRYVDQDQAGNVRASRTVEVFDYGTTTPIASAMYPSAISAVVLNPNTLTTSTTGQVELWIAGLSAPVTLRVGGVSGVTVTAQFIPDPATLALASALPSAIMTTQGDILVGGVSGAPGRFGIGTAWQELVVNAGATALQWANGVLARATTAGDLFQATGANAIARLGIGTAFQELTVNAGATAAQWSSGVLARVTTAGDLVQATGANAIARLPIGAAFQNLGVNAGATAVAYQASLQSLIQAAGDLVVGSAANTAIRMAKGADNTYLGVVAGALAWTTGTNVPLSYTFNDLTGDLALSNTASFFDGPSVSLTAGTWMLWGSVLVTDTAGTAIVVAKLWDGTNVASEGEFTVSGASFKGAIPLRGIVVVASTTTWKISARDLTSTSGKILGTTSASAGTKASGFCAVKIA